MPLATRLTALTNAIATAVNARAGRQGASAYDLAVLNGYTGTQAQWFADFQDTSNTDYAALFNSQLGALTYTGAATEAQTGTTQFANSTEAAASTLTTKALSPARGVDWLNAQNDALALLLGERRGTSAQRTALTAAQRFDGLRFRESDTGRTYIWTATSSVWYRASAMIILTMTNFAKTTITTNVVSDVPYDTLLSNDDINVFGYNTGTGANVQINRGGVYQIHAAALVGGDTADYRGMLIRTTANANLKEENRVLKDGRVTATHYLRVIEGSPVNVKASVYVGTSTNANFIDSTVGTPNYGFTVVRLGD